MAGKIVVEMSGEEQALLRSMRKVIAEQNKTEAGYKKIGRASDRAGKQAQKGFGASALGQLKSYALGVASIGTATALVNKIFAHMREEAKKAGESITRLAEARRMLVQVSGTSAEFQKFTQLADQLSKETGIRREDAAQVVFSAKSLGFLGIVRDIAQSREAISPAIAAQAAAQIPEITRGKVSPLGAINMALAAAEESAFNVEQFIRFLPAAAAGGQAAGSTPAQTAGMLSVIGGQFSRGSSAALRMKAFGLKVSMDEGLAGKGIKGAFDALQAMPKHKRREFLGESLELNELYNMIELNAATIVKRSGEVQAALDKTGTAESILADKRRIAMDPSTIKGRFNIAQRAADVAKMRREIAREDAKGVTALQSDAALNRYMAGLSRKGVGPIQSATALGFGYAASGLGLGAPATRIAAQTGRATGKQAAYNLFPGLPWILERLSGASNDLSSAASDLKEAAGQTRSAPAAAPTRRGAQLRERNTQRE